MGEFTVECTLCGSPFASDKEYNEHKCIEDDENSIGVEKIKQELVLDDSDDESEIATESTQCRAFENIKCENMEEEGDDEAEESDDGLDPLSFNPLDVLQIKQELDVSGEIRNQLNASSALLVDDVGEEAIRDAASALSAKCLSKYNCSLCGATFHKKDKFTKHFRDVHSSYRPFECLVCKKKFLHKHYVNLHMRVHTGEKPYVCQLCPKAYSHKTSFTIHMRIHNGERPYGCSVCGKKCYDKSGLTSHMRSHTKETPYQCEVCGRRFTHSKSLLVHRRNHTGEKPYICSYCGKAFRHWHKHKIHVRLHTGERPYKCKVCGKGFPRNDEVARHMRSHQGIKSFKCSICSVYCATQASITGHINLHHLDLKNADAEMPEKTLVKNGTSGILGTRVPEPRSIYKKINILPTYIPEERDDAAVPSTSKEQSLEKDTSPKSPPTRVIEVTSTDTPFILQKKPKKISRILPTILPKQTLPKPDQESLNKDAVNKNTGMSYKTFMEWQERMFANQGLIVQGYKDSKDSPTDPIKKNTINSSEKRVTSSGLPSAPQYLLLTQGHGENATKILLPINMASVDHQNSRLSQAPNNRAVGSPPPAASKPVYLMQQPNGNNNQQMILLSNQGGGVGGQKMFLLAQANGASSSSSKTASSVSPMKLLNIKNEPQSEDSMPSTSASPGIVIKTERPSSPVITPMNVRVKLEPETDDNY